MMRLVTFFRFVLWLWAVSWVGVAWAQADEGVLFTLGAEDAPIEVIEVVSLGCPTCRSFHRPDGIFEVFRKNYIENGHVRWVMRDHFWTKFDFWTARIVRCGDAAGRERRMDKSLERQSFITQDTDTQGVVNRLVQVAVEDMGLTRDQANACLQDKAGAEGQVTAHRVFLERYNLRNNPAFGTPFFIIDGEPIWNENGRVDYEKVNAIIAKKVIGAD